MSNQRVYFEAHDCIRPSAIKGAADEAWYAVKMLGSPVTTADAVETEPRLLFSFDPATDKPSTANKTRGVYTINGVTTGGLGVRYSRRFRVYSIVTDGGSFAWLYDNFEVGDGSDANFIGAIREAVS